MERKTELQLNYDAEARRKMKDTYQRALDVHWMNNRMDNGRTGRCLALIHREAEMEKNYKEKTDHAAIVNARVAKETALAYEVAKAQREQDVAYQRRHYIREREPILKDLARKLQAGYVCRDLQQQIRNNEYRRLQEKAKDKQACEKLESVLYSAQDYQVVEDQEKAEAMAAYRQELQQQLVFRQTQRQCQYEDTLIEKKMLEDVMRTIADEDRREIEQKRELMEKTRREMVTFKQAQQAWRAKQKEIVLTEEKEIERQKQALSDRESAVIAERQRKQRQKEETTEKIAADIQAKDFEQQERDNLISLLREQELLESNIQGGIDDKAKLERMKRETKEALTEQMQVKKRQEEEERKANVNYLKQLKDKMANEEAKEKEKQQQIRIANKKHCELLLKQAEEQRQMKMRGNKEEEQRAKAIWEYEKNWLAEVNKERDSIIREHVPHLLGYLQAGVIKKEDLPTVREGADLHPQLAKLRIEDLTQTKRPKRFAKCNAQCRILREY